MNSIAIFTARQTDKTEVNSTEKGRFNIPELEQSTVPGLEAIMCHA
jgi:hypothetical protein